MKQHKPGVTNVRLFACINRESKQIMHGVEYANHQPVGAQRPQDQEQKE